MTRRADYWISRLGLLPHPEGGFYREVYRSPGIIPHHALGNHFTGERSFSTAIYYLLRQGEMSRFHRIASDEQWIHVDGGNLEIHVLRGSEQGILFLGKSSGSEPFAMVPASSWFGALPADGADYTLSVCVVAPGFDFTDFHMGKRDELLAEFPRSAEIIRRLTE